VTDIHAYVWWLKRKPAINRVLRLFGLRLWPMCKFQVETFDGGTEMTSWWLELHRLSWRPEVPIHG
jgi:hypothetical protein